MKLNGGQACRYYYDDMGQLIREDNTPLGKTYVYTYDDAGNLLSKKIYTLNSQGGTPTGLISTYNYGYTDANWGDKLTSYRGHTITYDGVGNPLSYYNGKAYSFTWSGGRRLATASVGSYQLSFQYNDEGIRTSKTVGSVKHTYYLNGSQIMAETWGETLLVYLYDAEGNPIGMQYRNIYANADTFETYWFEKNLQGDIIAVYNSSGVKLISYTYDAWGNVTTSYHNGASNYSVADKNPFRYRGYYYDIETGFYYLQSRYYDPAIGRFINADAYTSTGQGILGNNMFAYCLNNPVCRIDTCGTDSMEAVDLDGNPFLDEEDIQGGGGGSYTGVGSGQNGPSISYLGGKMYPNSPGRLGGAMHRGMVDSLRYLFKAFGFDVSSQEKRVHVGNGKYRYPDLIVKNGDQTVAYIQVGKSTQSGDPIARERRAIDDLEGTGIPVFFYPYDD